MQTFLPYPSFEKSAKVMDYRRLGKQRVECMQLLKALRQGPEQVVNGKKRKTPWHFHPAATMWKKNQNALVEYGLAICKEWIARGYNDTCFDKISAYRQSDQSFDLPSWIGNDMFHAAHRSNLLRKNKEFYAQYEWSEPDNLEYVWPE